MTEAADRSAADAFLSLAQALGLALVIAVASIAFAFAAVAAVTVVIVVALLAGVLHLIGTDRGGSAAAGWVVETNAARPR